MIDMILISKVTKKNLQAHLQNILRLRGLGQEQIEDGWVRRSEDEVCRKDICWYVGTF
jgi:hypothetical protein